MFWKMIRKSLLENVRVNLWMGLTLALCAALIAMYVTISMEIGSRLRASIRQFGANAVALSARESSGGASMTDWNELKQFAEQEGAFALILRARLGTVERRPLVVVSTDPTALATMTPYWRIEGRRDLASDEGLLGRRMAERLGIGLGEEVLVTWPDVGEVSPLKIVGLFESGDDDEARLFVASDVVVERDRARALLSTLPPGHPNIADLLRKGNVTCVTCHELRVPTWEGTTGRTHESTPSDGASPDAGSNTFVHALLSVPDGQEGIQRLTRRLAAVGTPIEVEPIQQVVHGEETVLRKTQFLVLLALVAVLVLSGLGVSAAMLARIRERRTELALLQAVGAVRRAVFVFLLTESLVLGLFAALLGFVLGSSLATFAAWKVFRVVVGPDPLAFLAALLVTTLVASVAGTFATQRALRQQPSVALRGE